MSTKFRYEIEGVEVHPFGDWSIDFKRNEGQIFFRKAFRGDLTFKGDDYDYIMGLSECTVLDFEIFCKDVSIFTGQFKTRYSFKIDEDSCAMTGHPDTVDEYNCIMDNYEREYLQKVGASPNIIEGNVSNDIALGGDLLSVNDRNLWEVFQDMVNGMTPLGNDLMSCPYTCKSSFFNRDEFPGYAPGHYAGIYGTTNYVAPSYPNNELEWIYIARNSQIRWLKGLGGTRCDGYDTETITFKFFEDLFRERFNAYWYIDQNGHLRLEHISYFLPGFLYSDFETGIDLTALLRSDRKTFSYRTNKYEYTIDKLFDREEWSWQHYKGEEEGLVHNIDFQGVPIYYGATESDKSSCVPGEFKIKDSATPYIHSDFKWVDDQFVLGNYDILGCPGFMILNLHSTLGVYGIASDVGAYSGLAIANGFCSTANLQANFFTWERIFLTGNMNNSGATPITFDSEIPKRLQDEIEIAYCCLEDFDPMDYITTELGMGRVQTATFNKNSITVKLLYV